MVCEMFSGKCDVRAIEIDMILNNFYTKVKVIRFDTIDSLSAI